DEADRWLRDCEARRPEDPAVWRARLDWALAAARPDVARQTLAHIPADEDSDIEVFALRAWFADQDGDQAVERAAWEQLLKLDPGNVKALDRLAVLASAAGQAEQAAQFRHRRLELERVDAEYRKLLASPDAPPHAGELARLAQTLGRRVDREIWSSLAGPPAQGQAAGSHPPPHLSRSEPPSRRSLADRLADV